MTRATFGATAGDFVSFIGPGRTLRVGSATLTIWSAATGGTQYTDLLLDGSPVTSIPVGSDGQVPAFQAPAGVNVVWADAGGGSRVRLTPDLTGALAPSDSAVSTILADPDSDSRAALDGIASVTLAKATADGVTNAHTAFAADVASAQSAGKVLQLKPATYKDSTGVQAITASVRIDGRGATFSKAHGGNGFDIEPTGVAGGTTTSAAAAGDTTVTRTGAGWTVDEHAGKWVNLGDASHPESRKVVSNTATVLTLDEALGNSVASGSAITFYTPLDLVEITDLTIDDATGVGSANIIIRYAKKVRLRRLKSTNCAGNGITIYWCDDVVTEDLETDNTNFGCFTYYCGRVVHIRPKPKNWKSSYGLQIKDCREYGVIFQGRAVGDGVNSKTAFNIKASGLNPSRNLSIAHCSATATTQSALMMHSLQTEGTIFPAENFSIEGGKVRNAFTGWYVLAALGYEDGEVAGAGKFINARVNGVQVIGSTSGGFAINADDIEATDIQVSRGQIRGGTITGNRNKVTGRLVDNNLSGASSQELRLDGASDSHVDITVVHGDNASATTQAVRELNTCDRNEIRLAIKDTATTAHLTSDAALVGAASKVYRVPGQDALDNSASIVGIDIHQSVKRLTAAVPLTTTTMTDLTGLSHTVRKGGVYPFRVVLMADADIADDISVNFTYPSGTTGWYEVTTGASTSAAASANQPARFQGTKTFQNMAVGLIGAGTYAPVVIEGEFTVTTTGTFQVQAAQTAHTTGTTTVQTGLMTIRKAA